MIHLTRLRHAEPFFLNPDLFERVDTNVDTVVHLSNGTEYVVKEPGDEIVRRIVEYRARVLALAAIIEKKAFESAADDDRSAGELVAGVR